MSAEDGDRLDDEAMARSDALAERGRMLAQGSARRVQTGRLTGRDADLMAALIADLEAIELPPAFEEQRAARLVEARRMLGKIDEHLELVRLHGRRAIKQAAKEAKWSR